MAHLLLNTRGIHFGLGVLYVSHFTLGVTNSTHVNVIPGPADKTRSCFCSNVSFTYWGSSFTSTLYRERRITSIAMDSVSENLREKDGEGLGDWVAVCISWGHTCARYMISHLKGVSIDTDDRFITNVPPLKGRNASLGQSSRKRDGLNAYGSSQ